MAIQQNFPDEGPTLNLNFAGSRTLDPRITFTRTSSATYTGPDGLIKIAPVNSPRFDHLYNSTTGEIESLGLLVEEARTNLLLRSEEFGTTWSPLNVTVSADTSASPTGSLNADTITPAASAAAHLISQIATVPASMPHTASVYIKNDGAPFVQVVYDNGSSVGAFINVNTSTGAITRGPAATGGATGTTGSVTSVGNGWYRINVGATHTGTIGRILVSPLPSGSSTASINPSTTTAVTDKVILWGSQLEAGSFPTSYIPTSISTATRTADNASMRGENFSSWYNQSEGSVYQEFIQNTNLTNGVTYLNSGGNVNEAIRLFYNEGVSNYFYSVRTGGVEQSSITNLGGPNAGFRERIAFTYKNNDLSACRNGGALSTDSTASIPNTINRIEFGTTQVPTYLNGTLQRWCYYPKRLPNAFLQNLTK